MTSLPLLPHLPPPFAYRTPDCGVTHLLSASLMHGGRGGRLRAASRRGAIWALRHRQGLDRGRGRSRPGRNLPLAPRPPAGPLAPPRPSCSSCADPASRRRERRRRGGGRCGRTGAWARVWARDARRCGQGDVNWRTALRAAAQCAPARQPARPPRCTYTRNLACVAPGVTSPTQPPLSRPPTAAPTDPSLARRPRCARYGHAATAELLLCAGADANVQDVKVARPAAPRWGSPAADLRSSSLAVECCGSALFLSRRRVLRISRASDDRCGAGLTRRAGGRGAQGRTALHATTRYRHAGTARVLLDGGADPNVADRKGLTSAPSPSPQRLRSVESYD